MGNLILTNLAFWIFYLCPIVQKLLLNLFLSWFELGSEFGNIWMKGIKNGWIIKISLWIIPACLSEDMVHFVQD